MGFDNQREEAMRSLLAAQELLGGLGFTLSGDNTYYKDYALSDGAIARLMPVFDKGISLDVSHNLAGFSITTSKFIPYVGGLSSIQADNAQPPAELLSDVNIIIAGLGSQDVKPRVENFMITATCSECGTECASFLRISGRDTCIKCMGMDA